MLEMTPLSWWRSFLSFPNTHPLNPPVLQSPLPPIPYPAVPGHPYTDTLTPGHLMPLRCHIVPLVIPMELMMTSCTPSLFRSRFVFITERFKS